MTTTKPGAAVAVTVIALGVDMFLYGSIVPILPKLPAVNGSALISGLLFASYAVALLVATPFVGVWVDRAGPRPAMLAGLVGLAVTTVLFAGVAGGSLAVLLIARAAQGVAAAASWIAGLALIAATHDVERRGRVMGLALSAIGVGVLLGPAVSGALADAFGTAAPFLVVAALAVGDAVARLILIKPVPVSESQTPLRTVARGPNVPLLVLLTAVGAASIAFLEPILPLHLSGLGLGGTAIGLVWSGEALVGTLTAPLAGFCADKLGPGRTAAIGALLAAVGFLLSGMAATPVSIAGVIVVGLGAQLVLAPTLVLISVLAEHTRPPAYGAAFALYNLAYTTGLAIAPLAAGVVARVVDVPTATVVAAVAAAVLAVVTFSRRVTDCRRSDAAAGKA
ncbi:MFS transporter [Kutzneria sp. CA-103260]|uniref:MFS transporter n=1 Tax=Kutzneria sp. CA-103260 TaxID=2802641 RepID=UPI001BAB0DBF|nr:MFS transporter [Kutzneria sp. CA-103260]QUQ63707.1 putative MFS-type transporter YfcJ [Kutzneria sp. CA-103260]